MLCVWPQSIGLFYLLDKPKELNVYQNYSLNVLRHYQHVPRDVKANTSSVFTAHSTYVMNIVAVVPSML